MSDPNAEQLADATRAVRIALMSALYVPDSDGMPADPEARGVVDEAIQAQAAAIVATDELLEARKAASPLKVPLASASLGSASWTAASTPVAVPEASQIPAGGGLCRRAWEILYLGGLGPGWVSTRG